ncbi:MAG: hypothetical protein NTX51_13215, partial [Verrucomicrobia bacterium]|nr:hypothetical protein [Verrucomicrobiota bacterium]
FEVNISTGPNGQQCHQQQPYQDPIESAGAIHGSSHGRIPGCSGSGKALRLIGPGRPGWQFVHPFGLTDNNAPRPAEMMIPYSSGMGMITSYQGRPCNTVIRPAASPFKNARNARKRS